MPEPTKIPRPFAASGDKNSIPDSSGGLGFASWREGFPAITSAPFSEGGIAPKRADFNGIFNALSQSVMWLQQGGVYAYDADTDYEAGNVVLDAGGLYVANAANGPSSSVVQPSSDTAGATWKLVRLDLATQSAAGYMSAADKTKLDTLAELIQAAKTDVLQRVFPVGSIYTSYNINTDPAQLLGFGTWVAIQGRMLLGASSAYPAASTGGAASHTITVSELPSHSHTGSTASAGEHTHTAMTASAGAHTHAISVASAGAHTHSGTAANAGAHTHTRGTMNITGSFFGEGGIHSDRYSGAFYPEGKNGFGTNTYEDKYNSETVFNASRSWTGETSWNGDHSHSITVNSGGAHTHGASSASAGAHTHAVTVATNGAHTHTVTIDNTGGGSAMSLLPPYVAVYMWRRTA